MSDRRQRIRGGVACVVGVVLWSATATVAQPLFTFETLPELPGGASEAFGVGGTDDCQDNTVRHSEFSVGRSLDGDGIWKAVVWTKPQGQTWQIEALPNLFGNTESSALSGEVKPEPGNCIVYISGYANNAPIRVCVGGPNPGTPCFSNAECFPGGTCPPASEASPQPVVWTREGQGPWMPEVLPLSPGSVGGQVLAVGISDRDGDGLGDGWEVAADGTTKAAHWTRNEVSQMWTVELLPDYGTGFSSEAISFTFDPTTNDTDPNGGSLLIGGWVQTGTSPQVPCVWEEQPGGVFNRIDLPMLPGAYMGTFLDQRKDLKPDGWEFSAVGYNASIAGLADLYRGVLYRRENGLWGATVALPPLPGMRDAKATHITVEPGPNAAEPNTPKTWCFGHSYMEFSPGSERATLWEIASNDTVTVHDLNDNTLNLPPGITLGAAMGTVTMALPLEFTFMVGTYTTDDTTAGPGSTPHAYVLTTPPVNIPTLSTWGVAATVALLILAGGVVLRRARP